MQSIENRFEQFATGRIAILQDDFGGGRAVIVVPASGITPAEVNRVLGLTGGLLFVGVGSSRAEALLLDPMTRPSVVPGVPTDPDDLSWCVSVEAREGVTTGISAGDRAQTIRLLGAADPHPRTLVRPGHIFPVRVRDGGVLVRSGLAEGAVDLATGRGWTDAALFVDLLDGAGKFMTDEDQIEVSRREGIPLILLSELVYHRLTTEQLVECIADAMIPTAAAGSVRSILFRSTVTQSEHVALVKGDVETDEPVLVRVQPEFTFSDVFGGENPPTRKQLGLALEAIGRRGRGVLLYLRRTSPFMLTDQIGHWEEQFGKRPATMMREYGIGAQVLRALGVKKIELITSTPRKLAGLETFGMEIVGLRSFEELRPDAAR